MIHFLAFLMHFLDAMFLIGIAGSAIVVLLSFFDDFGELFRRDEV